MKLSVWIPVTLLALLATAGVFVGGEVAGSHAETSKMTGIADQLPVPPEWTKTAESVRPEKVFVCLDTNRCATMHRTWGTGRELSAADLEQLGARAGWELETDGDCVRPAGRYGRTTVCTAQATVEGYEVGISVSTPGIGEPQELSLHLEKIR